MRKTDLKKKKEVSDSGSLKTVSKNLDKNFYEKAYNEEFFTTAKGYSTNYLAAYNSDWYRKVVDWLSEFLDVKGSVLDLGCALGSYSLQFAKRADKVVGVDVSSFAIDKAKELDTKNKVTFHKVDFSKEDLPPTESKFDFVFSINLHERILSEDSKSFVANIEKVTAPGSIVFLKGLFKENLPKQANKDDLIKNINFRNWWISLFKKNNFSVEEDLKNKAAKVAGSNSFLKGLSWDFLIFKKEG